MNNSKVKIALVNPPMSYPHLPSLALTQLREVVLCSCPTAEVDVHYVNMDYASFLGIDDYCLAMAITVAGEWPFRAIAFPGAPDNQRELEAFVLGSSQIGEKRLRAFLQRIIHAKNNIGSFLDIIIDKYSLTEYNVIGITSTFSQLLSPLAIARRIKERSPSCVTVMGGANCESPMGSSILRNSEQLDFIFSGHSLKSFSEFVNVLSSGDLERLHRIGGVISRTNQPIEEDRTGTVGEKNGEEIASHGEMTDINNVIELNYNDFLESYDKFVKREPKYNEKPYLLFETSRGCWWGDKNRCSFCGLNCLKSTYASMDEEKAVLYINNLVKKYSAQVKVFESVDNIIPPNYYENVLPSLRIPEDVYLFYEIRSAINDKQVEALAKARVKIIQPGIESLNTSILKLMKKGVSSFTNISLLRACIENGIYPMWPILLGFPDETDKSVYNKLTEDLPRLSHLPHSAGPQRVDFCRYSEYFENPTKYSLSLVPTPHYQVLLPFSQEDIRKAAYHFQNTAMDKTHIRNQLPHEMEIKLTCSKWIYSQLISQTKENLPQLVYKGEYNIIDTRFEKSESYEIDPLVRKLLDYLRSPHSMQEIEEEFSDTLDDNLSSAFKYLIDKSLVFEENGRYLSLVCHQISWSRKDYETFLSVWKTTNAETMVMLSTMGM